MSAAAENLLADHIDIRTPGMLFQVVASLKNFVSKGLLVQTSGTCQLGEIEVAKPWTDDVLNLEFATVPGGTRYLLSVETYHGV